MRLSVVIPTYNRENIVARAINSVLQQTRLPSEVIVVDDGSTDRTHDALAAFGKAIRYVSQQNGGVSAARNRGLSEANGDVVAFLDSDDEWLPRMVEVATQAFSDIPDAVAVSANGQVRTAGSEHTLFSLHGPAPKAGVAIERVSRVMAPLLYPVTSGILIKRDTLRGSNWFDVNLVEYEDFDVWCRVALKGHWAFCHEPLWVHHRDDTTEFNVSSSYWKKPIHAFASQLRSLERLRLIPDRTSTEHRGLQAVVGNVRAMVGAMMIDNGEAGGINILLQSMLDYPSPKRVARTVAMLAGWRPIQIRHASVKIREDRKLGRLRHA